LILVVAISKCLEEEYAGMEELKYNDGDML
jgi:hypothetical protein